MIELLKEMIGPIAATIKSYVTNEYNAFLYEDNMVKLLESNYYSRMKIKNILHNSSPVLFMDIYCSLRIKAYAPSFEKEYEPFAVNSVKELFGAYSNVAIFGNAGSGKSTLVNFLYLNAIEECYKYPILISLRQLNERDISLVEYLKQETLGCKEIEGSYDLFATLLGEGHFLFFFDGYDEITPARQYNIASQIKELMKSYPKNKYVLTSRPLEQLYALDSFHNFVVQPLSEKERNTFIRRQFDLDRQDVAERIIKKITANPKDQYSQILNTPLLVILCILNFQLNSDLPIKKSEFYSHIFDALYQGHDWRSKAGYERDRKCNLSKDEYVSVLNKFSFYTHFNSLYLFTKDQTLKVLGDIKRREKDSRALMTVDNDCLFEDLTVAINILMADGVYYCFPHKSFQEYYAVNYIVCNDEQTRKKIYEKLILKFFANDSTLLTYSLLSMLYEMDKFLFVKEFLLPILYKVRNSIQQNALSTIGISRLERLLAMVNELFLGYDSNIVRRLFANGAEKNHLNEINKLILHAEHEIDERHSDEDFIDEILN